LDLGSQIHPVFTPQIRNHTLERDCGEWIVRCFACDVVDIIQPTLEIIGYRVSD
jgi:hypothetical protein